MTPAAPLEKAVEAYRRALDKVHHFDRQGDSGICGDESHVAGETLLAALDADKRLEKAEAALEEIADTDCGTEQSALVAGKEDTRTCAEKAPEHPDIWCGYCIARRYFAEKGERP